MKIRQVEDSKKLTSVKPVDLPEGHSAIAQN